jgi:hypothetical protein
VKTTDLKRYRRFLCSILKEHTAIITSALTCMKYSETEIYLITVNEVVHEIQKCNRSINLGSTYEPPSPKLYEYYVARKHK